MDALLSEQWIAELEIMEQLDQYSNASLSSGSFSCTTDDLISENGLTFERPTKLAKRSNSFDSFSDDNKQNICTPYMFNDCEGLKLKQPKVEMDYELIINNVAPREGCFRVKESRGCNNKRIRSMSSNANLLKQDHGIHAIAERRRREKLGERFAALSSIIPGLRKMDKATVLGDAVKYLKHLQEQIKILEEKAKKPQLDSSVLVKKSRLFMDEYENESEDNNSSSSNQENSNNIHHKKDEEFPVIEARIMDHKDVLITIHCERQCELLGRILNEMEKLHLFVIGSNSMAFGDYGLVVTITAQIETNITITAKDIVTKLMKLL